MTISEAANWWLNNGHWQGGPNQSINQSTNQSRTSTGNISLGKVQKSAQEHLIMTGTSSKNEWNEWNEWMYEWMNYKWMNYEWMNEWMCHLC